MLVTENGSMHLNIEFTYQIKCCYLKYLEVNKVGCMDRLVKYIFLVSEVITFRNRSAYNEHYGNLTSVISCHYFAYQKLFNFKLPWVVGGT